MDNKEVVINFFTEGYAKHKYEYIMECVADNYIDHSPAGARSNADAVNILKIVESWSYWPDKEIEQKLSEMD